MMRNTSHKEMRVIRVVLVVAVFAVGVIAPPLVGESLKSRMQEEASQSVAPVDQPQWPSIADVFTRRSVLGATNMSIYPSHEVMATIFWIGEGATAENAFITNTKTAWDAQPVQTFGGVDAPEYAAARPFMPKHNPYYFALPALEYDTKGLVPGAREASYWRDEKVATNQSLFKGRWVEIRNTSTMETVYAQWADVGPNEERDYGYVFGPSQTKPKNTFGLKAGIDISPSAAAGLGISTASGGGVVTWRFVNAADVPAGPWTEYPAIDAQVRW